MANDSKTLVEEDQIKHIPIADIFADHTWNARSLANTISEHGDSNDRQGMGILGLMQGMATDGQDTPIIVRPTPEHQAKRSGGKPYSLVCGFRRFEAVRRLNDDTPTKDEEGNIEPALITKRTKEGKNVIPNTANGTIRAVVRKLGEKEARSANGRENTDRENLDTPDLMHLCALMSDQHKMPTVEISQTLGITPSYVGQLTRIGTGVNPEILKHWREGGEFNGVASSKRVGLSDMIELSKTPRDRQTREYLKCLQVKAAGENPEKDKQWLEGAKRRGEAMGATIGALQKAGFLKVGTRLAWVDIVDVIVKVGKKELKLSAKRKIADAAEKAFADALLDKPEEGEEEAAE